MLEALFDIRIDERSYEEDSHVDAWICLDFGSEEVFRVERMRHPCYVVVQEKELVSCGPSSSLQFSGNPTIDECIRGRTIESDEVVRLCGLSDPFVGTSVLASKKKVPVWSVREVNGISHHFVSLSPPVLQQDETLFEHFHGRRFLHLLPLFLFLRALSEDLRWERPPLQACFMFDDPNLHLPTYGHIDFTQVAQHAKHCNYHVSFATVPIDGWFFQKATASLFANHRDQISLLMHGNDHIPRELGRPYPEGRRKEICRQAVSRMAHLEERSGVEVSRVMVPPHGVMDRKILAEMAQLGIEAACIPRGALRRLSNTPGVQFVPGMGPSDTIEGLTVYSRFPLSWNCGNDILISAILRQPIIPVGHHQDVRNGLDLLDKLSGFINSLGRVSWSSMRQISMSNYATFLDGETLRVKPFSKRIAIRIPENVSQVQVDVSMRETANPREGSVWRTEVNGSLSREYAEDEPIPVEPGHEIVVTCLPALPASTHRGRIRLVPLVRRLLSETRDRTSRILDL